MAFIAGEIGSLKTVVPESDEDCPRRADLAEVRRAEAIARRGVAGHAPRDCQARRAAPPPGPPPRPTSRRPARRGGARLPRRRRSPRSRTPATSACQGAAHREAGGGEGRTYVAGRGVRAVALGQHVVGAAAHHHETRRRRSGRGGGRCGPGDGAARGRQRVAQFQPRAAPAARAGARAARPRHRTCAV